MGQEDQKIIRFSSQQYLKKSKDMSEQDFATEEQFDELVAMFKSEDAEILQTAMYMLVMNPMFGKYKEQYDANPAILLDWLK